MSILRIRRDRTELWVKPGHPTHPIHLVALPHHTGCQTLAPLGTCPSASSRAHPPQSSASCSSPCFQEPPEEKKGPTSAAPIQPKRDLRCGAAESPPSPKCHLVEDLGLPSLPTAFRPQGLAAGDLGSDVYPVTERPQTQHRSGSTSLLWDVVTATPPKWVGRGPRAADCISHHGHVRPLPHLLSLI